MNLMGDIPQITTNCCRKDYHIIHPSDPLNGIHLKEGLNSFLNFY